MTTIAGVYFHALRFDSADQGVAFVGDLFADAMDAAAGQVFAFETSIEVELREGSLKGVGKVLATGLLIYDAIANYSGLKQSLREMVADSRYVGELVSRKLARSSLVEQGLSIERRTATPGALLRAIEQIDRATRLRLPPDGQAAGELERGWHNLSVALEDLPQVERERISSLVQQHHHLPPLNDPTSRVFVRVRDEDYPTIELPHFEGISTGHKFGTPPLYKQRFRTHRRLSDGKGLLGPPTLR